MKALDHIEELRRMLESEQRCFQDFADDHLNEGWLESVWKRLNLAFDDTERTAALDEAEREYERLRFVKKET